MTAAPSISDAVRALLDRARDYCAREERCESGVRQKLISWGAAIDQVDAIIARLRADAYLDDVRYATAFCRSKLLSQRWSRQKVLYQLRLKHLPKEAIEQGMATVDDDAYYAILADEMEKKLRQLGDDLTPEVQRKLFAFLASRGYTLAEINTVLKQ